MRKFLLFILLALPFVASAQISVGEGLNMPGTWNSWTNAPATGSVFGGVQTSGGGISLITTGTRRYTSTIKVAASGGDITGGSYTFLFTSGPTSNYWANKWAGVTVSMNSIQSYTWNTGADNSITVTNGKWYTIRWKDAGYANSQAVFMETSGLPVTISNVSWSAEPSVGNPFTVNITTSGTPSAEEKIFVRYTTTSWSSSSFVQATGSGTSWSATIPGAGVTSGGQYYVMTTTFSTPVHADADMMTINFLNNGGSNYPLPVELTTFSAKVQAQGVQLTWQTASEINNSGFEVQKSTDKTVWSKIGFVVGAGNSNATKNYSFVDKQVQAGTVYYRLKQIDNDGTFDLSKIVEASVEQPVKFDLGQNYPNPFNPSTQISYSVAKTSAVKISLFNALGQQVKVLENATKDAGFYTITVNATDLSSGVYYYKLEAGSFSQMKKMVVLK